MKNKTAIHSLKANAFLNVIKQSCSAVFPLITLSYVTRTLGNDQYGIYSFTLSYIGYFVLFAGLGISTYSVREGARIRSSNEINRFCSEVFSINVYSTIVSYILLIVITLAVPRFRIHLIEVMILSFGIVLTTMGSDWINTIYEDYMYLTVRYIVIQIVTLVLTFLFVRTRKDLKVYCLISIFALYGGNIFNFFHTRRYVKVKFIRKVNKAHLKPLLTLFANSITSSIYVSSDITMLGFYRSNADIGLYSFSSKLYNSAKLMLNAFISVSIPRLASVVESDTNAYYNYLSKIVSAICMVLFPFSAGMLIFRRQLIMILGGTQYLKSSLSLAILSTTIPIAILSSIMGGGILIQHRMEDKCLFSTTISAIVNLGLNFIFLPLFGIIGAAITTFIAELVNLIIQAYYASKIVSFRAIFSKDIFVYVTESIIVLIIGSVINQIDIGANSPFASFICIIIAAIVSAIVYIIILLITKNKVFYGLIATFNHQNTQE